MGLNYRDIILRLKAPPQIQFIQNHEAFSEICSSNQREGGDFILENKNRRTKMWACL